MVDILLLTGNLELDATSWNNADYYYCYVLKHLIFYKSQQKAAVTLQAWSGPEGYRKLRFPDFMTTAQDGGQVVSLTHRPPLPPGKNHSKTGLNPPTVFQQYALAISLSHIGR